jgi:TRAP-type uncharacterized transport system fused permease subunit
MWIGIILAAIALAPMWWRVGREAEALKKAGTDTWRLGEALQSAARATAVVLVAVAALALLIGLEVKFPDSN